MWKAELETAKKAAIEAGKAILEIYETDFEQDIEYKSDHSPLTKADRKSNALIVSALRKEFPDYAILSEEEKDNRRRLSNPLCFVVDPLDGTKEFVKRNGQFTVNIALAHEHKSVMGVIYVPVTGELYYASEGDGAYLETVKACTNPDQAYPDADVSRPQSDRPCPAADQFRSETDTACPGADQSRSGAAAACRQIHTSDNIDHSRLRAVVSGSHPCEAMEQMIEKYHIKDLLRIGSSLKGCLVAKGEADIYYRHNPTMEWDTAAMQCIVEEAGGIFRQMDGTEMTYNRENSLNEKGFYAVNRPENILEM